MIKLTKTLLIFLLALGLIFSAANLSAGAIPPCKIKKSSSTRKTPKAPIYRRKTNPVDIVRKHEFSKKMDCLIEISDSIAQSSFIDDFLKIPDLIKINNSLCKVFNFECPQENFLNFRNIDFYSLDFSKTNVLSFISGTKLRLKIRNAKIHVQQAAVSYTLKNESTDFKSKNMNLIKDLLNSISVALDAISDPYKYRLGLV